MRLVLVDDSVGFDRENAKTWAKPFTARLLEPGLVSYEDRDCGVALLRKETIDRDIHSFVGRPVVVKHKKTSPANMKEVGHGYITEVFYNTADGWWYGRGVVDTDEAAMEINRVGFGSVGYKVTQTGPKGSWHAMEYHEEIKGFSGEHLAIVGNPRYEEATIRLNSKATNNNTAPKMKLAFWKKTPAASRENASAAPAADAAAIAKKTADDKAAADAAAAKTAETRENATTDITPDAELEIQGADGKTEKVTVGTLVEAYNAKKNSDGEVDGDDEVMVNGKKVKMNALVAAYTKQNAADEDDEKKKRENAAADKAAEDAKAKAAEDANSKSRENGREHFRVLMTASERVQAPAERPDLDTREQRLNRGTELYGSAPGKN